jgi:hypothetical protein
MSTETENACDVFDDDDADILEAADAAETSQSLTSSQMTEAQKARAEKNRMKALSLKKGRLTARYLCYLRNFRRYEMFLAPS